MMKMPYADEQMHQMVRLWMCRMFNSSQGRRVFISSGRISDADVGVFLGLEKDEMWPDEEGSEPQIKRELLELHKGLEISCKANGWPEYFRSNLAQFERMLNLSDCERDVLAFYVLRAQVSPLDSAIHLFKDLNRQGNVQLVARALRLPLESVGKALSPRGALLNCGVLRWSTGMRNQISLEITEEELAEALTNPGFTMRKAMRAIATEAPSTQLRYADYPHIQPVLKTLRPFLRSALRDRLKGVNIYIYGPPGTGKTELTRVWGRELRAPVYEVSCEDSDGDPKGGSSRMMALRMAQSFLQDQRGLLVFDEAEDIFAPASLFNRSIADQHKAWINRMLESNPVPTIWLSNNGSGLDAAFMRRFDFIFELNTAPRSQRATTLAKICTKLEPEVVARMADIPQLTPAIADRAHAVAARAHPDLDAKGLGEATLRLVEQTLHAQGHAVELTRPADHCADPRSFDVSLLNADMPVEPIVANLQPQSSCRICLYGPPGTGKTAFGRWIAQRLDRQLQVRRASDILDPYVGGTEQKIAQVFKQAAADKALLLIDEVDSFLQDRGRAHRSWEVTAVNELLTQMERFPGIFIASTNLMRDLDGAALRRFDLKIRLDYLTADQARRMLRLQCLQLGLGTPHADDMEALQQLDNVTPGDFVNVARQHSFRRFASPAELVRSIAAECALKPDAVSRRIGF